MRETTLNYQQNPFHFFRYKLQRGLLDPPELEATDMEEMSRYFTRLEEKDPSLRQIRDIKLDKVMRRISNRDIIPQDLRQRAGVLARQWDRTDGAGKSTTTLFDTKVDASDTDDKNAESNLPEVIVLTDDSESESAGANQVPHLQSRELNAIPISMI